MCNVIYLYVIIESATVFVTGTRVRILEICLTKLHLHKEIISRAESRNIGNPRLIDGNINNV